MESPKDFREMTANSVGKDILQALVTEIKLLPDPWQKMSQAKQNDVIDRLRARVEANVKMAVHLIASEGRTVVAGDLDQITIKDGVKAVVKFGSRAENLHELYDVAGKAVLVVVANAADHTQGMDKISGESDQRSMDLGHEYDPKGDGKGMGGTVVDGEARKLPSPDDMPPSDEELQEYFESGYKAAEEGKPESDCPIVRSALVIEWMRGFHARQEEQDTTEVDTLYEDAVALVKTEQRVSISLVQRHLRIGYNRAARLVESMEAKGIVSAQDSEGKRIVLIKGEGKAA